MTTPAAWHPDPVGRHQLRYWDGTGWTEHVSNNGVTSTDPVPADGPAGAGPKTSITDRIDQLGTVDRAHDPAKIQRQINDASWRGAAATGPAFQGQGTLFTESILVVNQKAKLFELKNEYAVFDKDGNRVGSVTEIGQSAVRKAVRLFSNIDQFLTHRYEVSDATGTVQLHITRPAKFFKSTVQVGDANGQEIGRIVQANMIGKIRFDLMSQDQTLGQIKAENWRAWNFRVEDAAGTEVARITKTFEGFAKAMFTTADNYVVQIHRQLPQPLLSLVVAAALSIDTALKQDDNGF